MTFSVAVSTAGGLLVTGLLQALYTLILSPHFFGKDRRSLNDRIDSKKKRDTVAAIVFVTLTSILSVYTIKDQIMSGQVTQDDFAKLESRVAKLEHDIPPGTAQRLSDAETSLRSLKVALSGYATSKDLKLNREEIEKTIEKILNQIREIRTGLPRPQGG